jgi:transcription elongation factor Elf1
MGEIADDMVSGASCSHCGVYFKRKINGKIESIEHGYSVLCHHCFDTETEEERAGIQRSLYED